MGFKCEIGIQNKFRIKLYKRLGILILDTNPKNYFQPKQQTLTELLTLEELLLEDEELLDLRLFFFGGLLTRLSVTFVLLLFLSGSGSSPFFVKATNSGTFT
jgi:hypothetical protein